jgi:hypothetical protein
VNGPFTAEIQIAGPFKIDTKPIKIETVQITAKSKSSNWPWVLGIFLVFFCIAKIVQKKQ